MTNDQIAYHAVRHLSSCKYLYDSIVDGAIKAVFHQHNLDTCTPERFAEIKPIVVKVLKQIFPLDKDGQPHDS